MAYSKRVWAVRDGRQGKAGHRSGKARRGIWLLQIAILLVTTGCARSQGTEPRAQQLPIDYAVPASVCKLLNNSDLEVMLGYRYESGVSKAIYDQRLNRRRGAPVDSYSLPPFPQVVGMTPCLYAAPEWSGAVVASGVAFSLVPYVWGQVKGGEAIRGLGEEAFWRDDHSTILVLSKNKIFGLTLRRETDSPAHIQERAVRLARRAIGRLS